MIEQSLLDRFVEHVPVGGVLVERGADGRKRTNELIDDSATHPLMFDVFDDLNHGRVVVPSTRRSRSCRPRPACSGQRPNRYRQHAGRVPGHRPEGSPRGNGQQPENRAKIRNIKGSGRAPRQRARDRTRCSVRAAESLRTRSPVVRKRISAWWERTMRVAAMCKVLARTSERFDPEYAGLIGCCTASQNRCCSVTPTATVIEGCRHARQRGARKPRPAFARASCWFCGACRARSSMRQPLQLLGVMSSP